jgi:tagatose 1,6-diphosphate aldolase
MIMKLGETDTMELSGGKVSYMKRLADDRGVIAAAAMDQRGSLKKALAAARSGGEVTSHDMEEFKALVTEVLTPHASAILLDPEFGLPASRRRSKSAGLLLAYEESGYDNTQPGRLPDLLPHESTFRLKGDGADAVKVLIYYTPYDTQKVNDIKHAFIERIGDECRANEIPFFLEFVGYDPEGGDEKGLEYAKKKPEIVKGSMAEFTKDRYHVDVLKVEVPINLKFVEGTKAFSGTAAYSRSEAMQHFRAAADVATKPFIYLSAGVSNDEFTESLELAGEAGTRFSGVLCGRATWKDGIPVYATEGADAFRKWLETEGVRNIAAVNQRLQAAVPWFAIYGAASPEELVSGSREPVAVS